MLHGAKVKGKASLKGAATIKRRLAAPRKKKSTWRAPAVAGIPRFSQRPGCASGSGAYVQFLYAEKFTVNPPAAGLLGVYQFSLNSLFDPNITGTGHQPVNYDQYALMFDRYQVYRAQVKASVYNTNSQQVAGITATRDPTSAAAFEIYVENGITDWAPLDTAGSGQAVKTFTLDIDLSKLWGMDHATYMGHDRCQALFTNNPAEMGHLHCWVGDAQQGDPGVTAWVIEIRYYAKLTGGKLNALS